MEPVVVQFSAPLRGMDTREDHEGSPQFLLNVDMHEPGVYQARPGAKLLWSAAVDGSITGAMIVGLHVYRSAVRNGIVLILAQDNAGTQRMYVSILDMNGVAIVAPYSLSPPTDATIPAEPYTRKHPYSFSRAGRFLYFCNGLGNFYEMEWTGDSSIKLRGIPLAVGQAGKVMSYLVGNLRPSSLSIFFDQMVITGFIEPTEVPLSNPLAAIQTQVPQELIGASQNSVFINSSQVFVSEPALWRSYPVEDAGGMYYLFDQDVIASMGVRDRLMVFTKKALFAIVGHGTSSPQRIWIRDVELASPNAIVSIEDVLAFVATDGIYITNGDSCVSISGPLDDVYLGRRQPDLTRTVHNRLKTTTFPFHANRKNMRWCSAARDRNRRQAYFFVPCLGYAYPNTVFVWNYASYFERQALDWMAWSSPSEATQSSVRTGVGPPPTYTTTPTTGYYSLHVTASSVDDVDGESRVIWGTEDGKVYQFSQYHLDEITREEFKTYPVCIGLGRQARLSHDAAMAYSHVVVRQMQLVRETEDDANAAVIAVSVQPEGEALKFIDATNTDPSEHQVTVPNMQEGPSTSSYTILNKMVLGTKAAGGSGAPLLRPDYIDFHVQPDFRSEEARSVIIDILSTSSDSYPHRMRIQEIRIHGHPTGEMIAR